MTEKERQKEYAFKVYMTDSVKNINESVANMFGGRVMKLRFADMIKDQKAEETKTPEEIINNISSKLEKMRQSNERI